MKTRISPLLAFGFSVLAGTAAIYGCGDDDTAPANTSSSSSGSNATSGGTSGAGTSSGAAETGAPDADGPDPKMPALGTQLDRFGRPAVNTALNHTFDTDTAKQDKAKDDYNKDGTNAGWAAAYKAEIAKNLALYDGIDAKCGNQPFADTSKTDATRYDVLATVLADDRQWLDTKGTYPAPATPTAVGYLAVELNALGATNTEPGGRKLGYDVIDKTYGVVMAEGTGIEDGVTAVAEKTGGVAFPYLAAP